MHQSEVDLIIYEVGEKGKITRTTASGRKVLYAEREQSALFFLFICSPFWSGTIDLSLSSSDQLTVSGTLSAQDGTYNPHYPIYDSRTGVVLFLPRGVYVELAELALMYQSGKIPAYIAYEAFVDTDAVYEQSGSQLLVLIADASIYPL